LSDKVKKSIRKAVATFLFSTIGVTIGVNVLDADIEFYKLVLSTGIGAVLNYAYRWAESVMKEDLA